MPERGGTPRLSVVMAAHDEADVIGPTLRTILDGDPEGEIEIVVVPNGCTDETARIAAEVSDRVRVEEIATPSKIAALNAGDAVASTFPRAYVDADVSITAETLRALARALDGSGPAHVAAPRLVVDTRGATWFARQYYRIWELSEYRATGHIGSGVYALSAEGRRRFGAFPDVIADDRFVQQQFELPERLTLPDHSFTVRSPRTLRAQMHRATRIVAGNRELPATMQRAGVEPASRRTGRLLRRVLRRPGLWPALPVYAYGYVVPHLRARRHARTGSAMPWHRDDSSRTTGPLDEGARRRD